MRQLKQLSEPTLIGVIQNKNKFPLLNVSYPPRENLQIVTFEDARRVKPDAVGKKAEFYGKHPLLMAGQHMVIEVSWKESESRSDAFYTDDNQLKKAQSAEQALFMKHAVVTARYRPITPKKSQPPAMVPMKANRVDPDLFAATEKQLKKAVSIVSAPGQPVSYHRKSVVATLHAIIGSQPKYGMHDYLQAFFELWQLDNRHKSYSNAETTGREAAKLSMRELSALE